MRDGRQRRTRMKKGYKALLAEAEAVVETMPVEQRAVVAWR